MKSLTTEGAAGPASGTGRRTLDFLFSRVLSPARAFFGFGGGSAGASVAGQGPGRGRGAGAVKAVFDPAKAMLPVAVKVQDGGGIGEALEVFKLRARVTELEGENERLDAEASEDARVMLRLAGRVRGLLEALRVAGVRERNRGVWYEGRVARLEEEVAVLNESLAMVVRGDGDGDGEPRR